MSLGSLIYVSTAAPVVFRKVQAARSDQAAVTFLSSTLLLSSSLPGSNDLTSFLLPLGSAQDLLRFIHQDVT